MRHFVFRIRGDQRGQSFVELALVLLILALLLAGVVEFGYLMNNYLHVLDAAREAARYSSSADFNNPDFYYIAAAKAASTMAPVELDPVHPDDIVISVFSVSGGSIVRFPSANGWSLCAHYASFAAYFPTLDPPAAVPPELDNPGWNSGCTVRASLLTSADILNRMDASAPNSGVLLVEVYYNYPQLLKLPIFSNGVFLGVTYSIIPDPIPLYVYTVMPLSSAEPAE
jgi:hypothetical protein